MSHTNSRLDFVDITDLIQSVLDDSGIREGQVTVFSPHTTCPIVVNECESGLLADIRRTIAGANGSGGDRVVLGSASAVLPAAGGKLRLGGWQRVLLVELDAASSRVIPVQIVGE